MKAEHGREAVEFLSLGTSMPSNTSSRVERPSSPGIISLG